MEEWFTESSRVIVDTDKFIRKMWKIYEDPYGHHPLHGPEAPQRLETYQVLDTVLGELLQQGRDWLDIVEPGWHPELPPRRFVERMMHRIDEIHSAEMELREQLELFQRPLGNRMA